MKISQVFKDFKDQTKPDQTKTKTGVLCQEEVISLQSSAQAEALRPDSCIQDQGTTKKG